MPRFLFLLDPADGGPGFQGHHEAGVYVRDDVLAAEHKGRVNVSGALLEMDVCWTDFFYSKRPKRFQKQFLTRITGFDSGWHSS